MAVWKMLVWMVGMVTASPGAWAVMKCTAGGKTWYQDAPCPSDSSATPMHFSPAPTAPAQAPAPAASAASPTEGGALAQPPRAPALPAAQDPEALMCLAWYQKEVPLASGTRYLSATREGRVLTLVISIPFSIVNFTGARVEGTTDKSAACEVHNGTLDDGWTRIHAKRGQWIQ